VSTPRREFLGLLGAGALASAAPSIMVGAQPARRATPRGQRGPWDLSWTERLRTRYRVVFDAPDLSEGDPILRAMVWGRQYQEAFGVEPRQAARVLVLRHLAIHFAMNDRYWARFGIAAETGFNGSDGKPLALNPVRAARADVPEPYRNLTLEAFQQSGGIVLACQLALTHYVVPRYQAAGLGEAEAAEAALADMLPGIIRQPSGIFAVSVAQDHGCRYVPVS
jgi:hypothetical protein